MAAEREPRLDRRFDWVGPQHPRSKIRPIRLRRSADETAEESAYREARQKLNEWNSSFWEHHNQLFDSEKAQFVAKRKEELGRLATVSAADMSSFYSHFLNSRREALSNYNREWYQRNLCLIWPALRVNFLRARRLLLRR